MQQEIAHKPHGQLVLTCTRESGRLVVRVREDTDPETLDAVARSLADLLDTAEGRAGGVH